MFTGQYLPQHRVVDNVIWPEHLELDPAIPTVGSILRDAGYRSSYIGKWHLSQAVSPDMTAYGFADWEGNDRHFMGWAGTGVHFDPIIASNAASWLRANATGGDKPWFLTVALVNPHDVMWFPIDQPAYHADPTHAEEIDFVTQLLQLSKWKDDDLLPLFRDDYAEVCEELPAELRRRPARQARDATPMALGSAARHVGLHRPDRHEVVAPQPRLLREAAADGRRVARHRARRARSRAARTTTRSSSSRRTTATCAGRTASAARARSSTRRSCTCRATCARPASRPPGTQSSALGDARRSRVDDLRARRRRSVVAAVAARRRLLARARRTRRRRSAITCCSRTTPRTRPRSTTRATRSVGSSTGQTKYALLLRRRWRQARRPGCGARDPGHKVYDVDAAFEDQEHEWYDLTEDPHELVNLAHDRGRRAELAENYQRLLDYEAAELS